LGQYIFFKKLVISVSFYIFRIYDMFIFFIFFHN